MSNRQSQSGFKLVALVVVSTVFALAIMEVGLRVARSAGVSPEFFAKIGGPATRTDVRDGPGLYYVHPYSAYNMKPGYAVLPYQKINSLGFRGDEVALEKPAGTYRIVALGASTTFGIYLAWDQTYPYYLQQDLRKRLGTENVEVINGGLTGSTTAESLHRLFYQILPLKPDMVIFYEAYNDLFPRVFNNYQSDYFHFRRSDAHYAPGLTRFELYRLALRILNPYLFAILNDQSTLVWKKENLPDEDNVRLTNFFATSSREYEQNLDYIVSTLIANDVQPVLATFANKEDELLWNDDVPAFAWEVGISQNNEALRRVAAKYNVPLIPFAELAADLPQINIWTGDKTKDCCFTDSIHFSAPGNKIRASIFADTIEPIIKMAINKDQSAN